MTELSGAIKKIFFQNDKNGYTVALFETSDDSDQLGIHTTITGILPHVKENMPLVVKGNWVKHKTYGEQFSVESFKPIKPDTKEKLETFLSSGTIPGISKKLTKRIIEACGDNFLNIIETNPQELLKINGLGKKTLQKIIQTFRDQSEGVEVIAQMQELGLTPNQAKNILDFYKKNAINIVMNDPYDLALNIPGIGFVKSDDIAEKVGLNKTNEKRNVAGILYCLMDCYRSGHTYLDEDELKQKAQKLLSVSEEDLEWALSELVINGRIIQSFIKDKAIYYPTELFKAESDSAYALYNLAKDDVHDKNINFSELIKDVERDLNLKLDESQINAIETVTQNPITVITGGPGTGKSATCSIVK